MSTTIDAAIIKALVEHVGGDSSGIPNGTIGGKTYTAGDGIDITDDAISVKYDENSMEIKDGKLAAKGGDSSLTKAPYRPTVNYSISTSKAMYFAGKDTLNNVPIGSYIITQVNNKTNKWIIVDKVSEVSYALLTPSGGGTTFLSYNDSTDQWTCTSLVHQGEITDEYGLFIRGQAQTDGPTEVVPADEYSRVIGYIFKVLSTKADK